MESSSSHLKLGYVFALLSAIMFGSVSAVAKPALTSIHTILVASIVYILAALVSTPLIREKYKPIQNRDKGLLLAIALSGAIISPVLFFEGLSDSSASDSALLLNAEIIFSVFFALLIFRERLPLLGYFAVGFMIIGIIIVTTDLEFSSSAFDVRNIGNLFIIGATLFWALDNNLSKILSQRMDAARIVQLKSAIGGSVLLLLVFVFEIPISIEIENIPNLLILGVLGFGASIFFFLHGLKRIGTVKTIMIFSTSSVFGLIFASAFLGEEISSFQILAMGIILGGFFLMYRKK